MKTPVEIAQMHEQLGGTGLSGAFVYCGANRCTYQSQDLRPSQVLPDGTVDLGTGLVFHVNGKRGQNWRFIVSLEPSDTYTVRLWRSATAAEQAKGLRGVLLEEKDDIYCDTLQECVEGMYDRAIAKHCDGFIPS